MPAANRSHVTENQARLAVLPPHRRPRPVREYSDHGPLELPNVRAETQRLALMLVTDQLAELGATDPVRAGNVLRVRIEGADADFVVREVLA